MKASGNRRERGAYFTPTWLARSLAMWAIRDRRDVVIDPAAGDGKLLVAAAERLLSIGGTPRGQVVGVELHARTSQRLKSRLSGYGAAREMMHGDFFMLSGHLPKCDAVIANPPYVRHHQIQTSRIFGMRRALDGQAHLVGGRASAWAYFLVHAPSLLKSGGRLAFVLPAEVLSADYARIVVDGLASCFHELELVYCNGPVFPGVSQRTILCLADGYDPGTQDERLPRWRSLKLSERAVGTDRVDLTYSDAERMAVKGSLIRLLAPPELLKVEEMLVRMPNLRRLGDVASIGIGYVTGANGFFHLSDKRRRAAALRVRHLTKVLTTPAAACGLRFTDGDWAGLRKDGRPCWLFSPTRSRDVEVQRYLSRGRRAKVNKAYKCRTRSPWWEVVVKEPPPAFMSYMGTSPRIFANHAAVPGSNSLFELRIIDGVAADALAVASLTSVFRLSAVLNARLLGGGLRKLEPSDATRLLVPISPAQRLVSKVDRMLRAGKDDLAQLTADRELLVRDLGMADEHVTYIRTAVQSLVNRL